MKLRQFISLAWKKFKRSPAFEVNLAVRIILWIGIVYFGALFLIVSAGGYYLLKLQFPDQDPLVVVNVYLIFWSLGNVLIRYCFQNLPSLSVKPFMTLPVSKKSVVRYILTRNVLDRYNLVSVVLLLPFSVNLLIQGYHPLGVIGWFLALLSLTYGFNFLNILLKNNAKFFWCTLGVTLLVISLKLAGLIPINAYSEAVFQAFYEWPALAVGPLFLAGYLGKTVYDMLKTGYSLEGYVSKKAKKVRGANLEWLNRFGLTASFLKTDIRMIVRNVRPRKTAITGFLFVFYGLMLFFDYYADSLIWKFMSALLVTGGFSMTFGQLVPSWDSEYYPLLMSQNIAYRDYLNSKWVLMVVGSAIMLILALPYALFSWQLYWFYVVFGVFNIGYMSLANLYAGVFNKIPIKLNQKAKMYASNKNGFSIESLLVLIPKVLVPGVLFFVPFFMWNLQVALRTVLVAGLLGLVFKNPMLRYIEGYYQKHKYKTLDAFSVKE